MGRRWLGELRNALLFFDTLGIGIYTIFGMQKALSLDVNNWPAILLGMLSAGTITLIRLLAIRKGWSLPRIDNQ